jgi:hypothetical protein
VDVELDAGAWWKLLPASTKICVAFFLLLLFLAFSVPIFHAGGYAGGKSRRRVLGV